MYTYSSLNGVIKRPDDLVAEACEKAKTDDVVHALAALGYRHQFEIGIPDFASIELYRNAGDGEFTALAYLTIGSEMQLYGMRSFHDTVEFLREYVPTIKAISELAEKTVG